jgi:hypothetical protein
MDQYGFGSWNVPRRGILKVHGENGAQSLQMQPDDNCIALDETNPEGKTIIWVIATDSRGIKTVCKPYEVTEYIPKPPINVNDIDSRLKRLEDFLYGKFGNASTDGAAEAAGAGNEAKPQH